MVEFGEIKNLMDVLTQYEIFGFVVCDFLWIKRNFNKIHN